MQTVSYTHLSTLQGSAIGFGHLHKEPAVVQQEVLARPGCMHQRRRACLLYTSSAQHLKDHYKQDVTDQRHQDQRK